MKTQDAKSFVKFLTDLSTKAPLPADKQAILDGIKSEMQVEQAAQAKITMQTFHQRMQKLVKDLREIRVQEKAKIAQIKELQAEVENFLLDKQEDVKI